MKVASSIGDFMTRSRRTLRTRLRYLDINIVLNWFEELKERVPVP